MAGLLLLVANDLLELLCQLHGVGELGSGLGEADVCEQRAVTLGRRRPAYAYVLRGDDEEQPVSELDHATLVLEHALGDVTQTRLHLVVARYLHNGQKTNSLLVGDHTLRGLWQ